MHQLSNQQICFTHTDFGPVSKEGLSVPLAGTKSGETIGVLTSGGDSQG